MLEGQVGLLLLSLPSHCELSASGSFFPEGEEQHCYGKARSFLSGKNPRGWATGSKRQQSRAQMGVLGQPVHPATGLQQQGR